jgi:hypothetical protein
MEPYWHETRIIQLIGRAIRQCYHKDLPMEERTVDVFRYQSIKRNGEGTIDEKIKDGAHKKQILIDSFLKTVREAAVDCKLFENHNMMSGSYQCFQFNESSLFDQQVGPAYNEDIYYDTKLNNGLNAINSEITKVKVMKIKGCLVVDGVKQNIQDYWYNPNTHIVYDIDLDYPIGKVKLDIEGTPARETSTSEDKKSKVMYYLIEEVINIPKFGMYKD